MIHMTTCLIFRFSAFENSDENVSIEVTPFNDLIRNSRELIISLFSFLYNVKVMYTGCEANPQVGNLGPQGHHPAGPEM